MFRSATSAVWAFLVKVSLTSHNAVSQDLLKPYERGLYEHCALHAGDPHWGGMIADRKPWSAHNSSLLVTWNVRVPPR